MKRLISWLLALTLIIGLLPMSVFAAVDVETEDEDADMTIDMWELLEGGSEANPLDLTNDLVYEGDFSATVTVPAGKTLYCTSYRVATMEMTINDGEAVVCTGDNWTPYAWTITNDGEAEAKYTIKVAFPEGHQQNPEVIEELAWSYFTVEQAAGDDDGYYYIYTAPADGTVTVYFTEVPGTEAEYDDEGNEITAAQKYTCDIAITNNNTYANKTLLVDGVDNYGLELTVEVSAGDELVINVCAVQDIEGNYYPEAAMTWCGNFVYPVGTEQNPSEIYVTLDDTGAAEVTVTVPAGEHNYYVIYGANGTTLAVNGEGATEITMFNNAVDFDNTEGTEDATYVLSFSTPVGAYMNPEVIEDMNDYEDPGATVEGSPYYYSWTAPADGTVTLDVTDGANITVNNQNTYAQYVLAEVSYDDNWNFGGWTVAENLVIEVAEGDVLKIEVAGYSNDNAWDVPAVDYTLYGDFEVAAPAAVYSFAATGGIAPFLSLEDEVFLMIGFDMYQDGSKLTADTITDDILANFGVAVWAVENKPATDDEHTVEHADYCLDGAYWHTSNKRITVRTAGIPAKNMGDAISFRPFYKNADGTYVYGRIIASYSPRAYAESNANKASNADNFRAMMVALMNYGAAAQEYFGYKTDDLMNSAWTDEQKATTWDESMVRSEYPTDKADASWVRDSSKITSRTANLTLEGAITVNLYAKTSFTVAKATAYYWTEATYNSVDALTLDNASSVEVIEAVDDQGRWTAGYDGVAAKDLFNTVYSMIVFEDTDGNVHYTGVVAYSAERFAYTNRNKTDASAELARRLACYSVAAQNYFFGQ